MRLPLLMNVDKSLRRLRVLRGTLQSRGNPILRIEPCRLCATSGSRGTEAPNKISIGDVSIKIKEPKCPELVPVNYVTESLPQSVLRHLRWIMQKDLLGQDVFIIGAPGPLRRQIAMMYLELTKREGEYISLSRDITEADLKQRREIRSGSAFYLDQCAVRAAVHGRILILEGIEKAERNVLPILNNLLENREMQLEDGKFLMAAQRYDKLLQDHTKEELDQLNLVRVDENFRVIALGLPVPRYQGNPLDPPLRSRFQARDLNPLPFKEHLELLQEGAKNVTPERLSQLLSFASTMVTKESTSLGLPDFPISNLQFLVKIMDQLPDVNANALLQRLYPYDVMLRKEGQTAVKDMFSKFELPTEKSQSFSLGSVERLSDGVAQVILAQGQKNYQVQVQTGSISSTAGLKNSTFVQTGYHSQFLAEMMQSHLVKDFCIIGPRGCGKTALVQQFARILGYHIEPIMLYQDMTSRDLLQQRTLLPNGDTAWRPSPLVTAAMEGSLAVLDGIHRINLGSFSVLHRLIHERELQLFDGSRLISQEKYETIKEKYNFTSEDLEQRKIYPIHPGFRIIALGEPPVVGSSTQQWLNPEMLTMFLFHNMRPLAEAEETTVIKSLVPNSPDLSKLFSIVHQLRQSADPMLGSISTSLSTRQLIRIARRLANFPSDNLNSVIQKACLARFLPRLAKSALDQALDELQIQPIQTPSEEGLEKALSCEINNGRLRIGLTEVPIYSPENRTKVPDVLFYENAQHLSVMEDMLKDFLLDEHLLLIGNQGVGKNKIVDRFLYLLNRPREYIQLHRDTTVQTLTLQPTVLDGVIIYEDSPLVRAVKLGHVLVVDEADKAPTNVTCILKTLVESGEMHLADGRRIVTNSSGIKPSDRIIVAHPDFRMIVLANRPGFPFLGNDFFGAMGDIFSCHAIDNPNMESEMSMLRQYGPNVPEATLRKLVMAFGELRDLADQGLIAYPYSTREVVNIIKHLQKYPNEGLTSVVRNVFDFDSYNSELRETLLQTMQKHGIPLGADTARVNLAKEFPLPKFELQGQWKMVHQGHNRNIALMSLPVETRPLQIKGPVTVRMEALKLDRTEARSDSFSEQTAYWTLPMQETNILSDIAVTKASHRRPGQTNTDIIHISSVNPVGLFSINHKTMVGNYIDLYDVFPSTSGSYKPIVKLFPLSSPLDDTVILHEEVTNIVLSLNFESGQVSRLISPSLPEVPVAKRRFPSTSIKSSQFKLCQSAVPNMYGTVVFYKQEGDFLDVISVLEGIAHTVSLPVMTDTVLQVGENRWIITEAKTNKKFVIERRGTDEFILQSIEEDGTSLKLLNSGTNPLSDYLLSKSMQQKISTPNRVVVNPETYATLLVGFPELSSVDVYGIPRQPLKNDNPIIRSDPFLGLPSKPSTLNAASSIIFLPESGQVVRTIPTWKVPEEVTPKDQKPHVGGYMEVSDLADHKLRYIAIPGATRMSPYASWMFNVSDTSILVAGMSNDGLVTVDVGGCVRLWETSLLHLEQSLQEWRNMIGWEDSKPIQITQERESDRKADGPKHGKVDEDNQPHVGGNTWAGGTGGSNTAGLGGFGGPYRLDAGHNVTQVPQWQKDNVPEEVKKAAREMAEKAFKERLREIHMSEYDGETYETFSKSVRKQVKSLRVILDSLQAKGKERQWLKNQTYGDLDDAKLIDGLTGEKSVYKRRGEKEPEMGSPQELPKRLRLLVDVSGSMYRFNGFDGRLEREMEATLMVMEALENYEEKFKYDIYGHSGEDHKLELVPKDKAPKNNKDRLIVIKTMHAHAQFCLSGDNTLSATKHAIETLAQEEADEHFLIMLSDANFDRYGISPKRFGELLRQNDKVNAYAIFIGSLGDQALRLTKQLPMGHSFICMDTKNLPQILQQIFTSTMLQSSK
ncbi:hypothetical protein ACJMK2_007838 [Sinanodonta woodiana]|uniref:von Willebrand factor A domain-containing protein 8 n=1 Tax=Sinanodonta woodiana TaxID=1069815 RepID=A0ABD3VMQ3_SINWO